MNRAIKAALLSALVFPGVGQFYLKRYRRGLLIMMLIMLGLAIIAVRATIVALDIIKEMQGNGAAIDVKAISHLAETFSLSIFSDNTAILMFLIVFWIISVADAYRIGKRDSANVGGDGQKAGN